MGLIKATFESLKQGVGSAAGNIVQNAMGSLSGVTKEQYREFFICDSFESEVLAVEGRKKNQKGLNKGNDNIISNGSMIVVNAGQAALIVDQGKVVEFCAEAGEFLFDTSSEPSLLSGNLGENIKRTFSQIGKRFTFGGDTGKDQRVYFFNTKEIPNNLFGTANPVPFRVVDQNINPAEFFHRFFNQTGSAFGFGQIAFDVKGTAFFQPVFLEYGGNSIFVGKV